MPKRNSIAAESVALWFCPDGHLHVVMLDETGEEIAFTAIPMEDGMEIIGDLLVELDQDHGITLHSISDDEDDDEIGPLIGSC